jgi:NADPH2:quinone reductase
MRAIRFDRFGDPTAVLELRDLPMPEPGEGQVRIRMRARPINPSDLFTITGEYGNLPTLPATPGGEGAGVVDEVGAGVSGFQVGQQVVPLSRGTWQEYVVADAGAVIPVPPGLTDIQASMLLVNPTSAWLMLEEDLRVQPGEWLVQNGGNSAVARFVAQIAKLRGYRIISVVRRRDVEAELLETGAEHVICESDEDVVERVREITAGVGVPYAIDSVGGASGSRLVQTLGSEGTMLVFGAISRQPLTIASRAMLYRGSSIRGWWLTRWMRRASRESRDQLFRTLTSLVASGTLHAPVAAEFDLADVVDAVRMASGSERNGKVLLVG